MVDLGPTWEALRLIFWSFSGARGPNLGPEGFQKGEKPEVGSAFGRFGGHFGGIFGFIFGSFFGRLFWRPFGLHFGQFWSRVGAK